MSLDTVEFIIAIEKHFSITIKDKDAEKLVIIGEIAQYVVTESKLQNQSHLELDKVLSALSQILHKDFGVEKKEINADSHLVYDLGLD